MKKLLLLTFIILSTCLSYGQKIRFTDTSNKWTYVTSYWDLRQVWVTSYKGDSIINGIKYIKHDNYLIRQDTIGGANKIYIKDHSGMYISDDTSDILLYDFNAKVGDTLLNRKINGDSLTSYITAIDSVAIGGVIHKIWKVQQKGGIDFEYIEGIGCTKGVKRMLQLFKGGASTGLICFKQHGNIVTVPNYIDASTCKLSVSNTNTEAKQFSIHPHPANQHSKISFPNTIQSGSLIITDIFGRVIVRKSISNQSAITLGELPISGLYFYTIIENTSSNKFSSRFVYQ